jgi:SAM-dependent methyltransferase
MEVSKYHEMAKIQNHHWWFRGRRFLFGCILKDLQLSKDALILEIGCGTGANLSLLNEFGTVYGVEMDEYSRNYAREHFGVNVEYGMLPDTIPYAGKKFDLICMFDVLEHVQYDGEALKSLRSHLKEGGLLFLSVPAMKWLYGEHDKMFHHYRRYSRNELTEKLLESGYQSSTVMYFNSFLFPLALVARAIDLLSFRGNSTGMDTPPRMINSLLYCIFCAEHRMLRKSLLPFGLSLMAIARAS